MTLDDIARDPHQAMRDLEKKFGAQPGELLAEMRAFGDGTDDWTQHLPFTTAQKYYSNKKLRQAHEAHVGRCTLCQSLLDSLHPDHDDSAALAAEAARTNSQGAMMRRVATAATALAAATVAPLLRMLGR